MALTTVVVAGDPGTVRAERRASKYYLPLVVFIRASPNRTRLSPTQTQAETETLAKRDMSRDCHHPF